MKIDELKLRAAVMERVREYQKEVGEKVGAAKFFEIHDVNRGRLYTCAKKGSIGKNYYSKLKLIGVDVDSALLNDSYQHNEESLAK